MTRNSAFANWSRRLAPAMLVLAVLGAYANSLHGPFVFDDLPAIRDNPSLDRLATALRPPAADGNTVGGRPLLNLTFALNRELGGLDVRGYHAFNLLVHAAAALALFGVARRVLAARDVPHGTLIAFVGALLWAVHPLATSAVTYLAQRAESLAGLLMLAGLYAFLRGTNGHRGWLVLAAAAAFAGAATKETTAVLPLLVLLVDRTLFSGSIASALRRRPVFYAALAAAWIVLAALVAATGGRGGSVGFGGPIDALAYLATQCRAIPGYLQLAIWPHPLVFDYGSPLEPWARAAPFALLLGALVAVSFWAFRRRSLPGLAGVAFFLLLAPSSSVVPVTSQTIAEHRMYLPLAVVLLVAAAAAARFGGRRALVGLLALAAPLLWTTLRRNLDYRSSEALWADTVAKRPSNPRAHNNLGLELAATGRTREALAHFETAVRLAPDNPEALNNLGNALRLLGRPAEAIAPYERALQLRPGAILTRINLATALFQAGRPVEAAEAYAAAARLGPLDPESRVNHGAALLAAGRPADAVLVLEAALAASPPSARAHYNLGNAYAALARWPDAVRQYREAVRLAPDHLPAQANLGNALLLNAQPAAAADAFAAALRLRPGDARLEASLARARAAAAGP